MLFSFLMPLLVKASSSNSNKSKPNFEAPSTDFDTTANLLNEWKEDPTNVETFAKLVDHVKSHRFEEIREVSSSISSGSWEEYKQQNADRFSDLSGKDKSGK